jgi:small-conductance mechanosensitive channel/CRP-like cAMP-binding protein
VTGVLLPLLLASLVVIAAIIVPRLFRHWPLWLRALWRFAVFVALTFFVQRILGSPLRPHFHTERAGEQFWEQIIEAGWWMVGARCAVGVARLVVVLENRPRETQMVSDLIAGAIYVATLLAIVNFVFAVPIGGLLATSGIIAIVLGLAMQSTLSDVFSGIAVGIERPYKAGDLLWVEGGIEGHVIQVNWRSTHIATGHNNIAVVPNSIIAKARLVNRSLPSPVRGDSIEIRVDANAPPARCADALTAAVRGCRLPLSIPPPGVAFTALHGDGAVYEISFSVHSSEQLGAAKTELLAQVQRHLRNAGIPLAVAGVATVPELPVPTPSELLEQSDLFGVIDAEERDQLAKHLTVTWLEPKETLIRQGDAPDAIFVLASGAVEITINGANGPRVVHRMGPGESLGAIGMITQTPYSATATALTPTKAYRLDKQAIAAAIQARPQLAAGLEALAKRGQATLSRDAAAHDSETLRHPEMFLTRLRSFLRVLASADPLAGPGGS